MLEREMEDLIAAHPDHFYPRHGLVLVGRQQSFHGVGRFDLLFRDRHGMHILMELKAVPAGYEAIDQVSKYKEALSAKGVGNVLMWIVAPTIPASMRQFLLHLGIEYTEISEPEFRRAAALFNYSISPTVPPNIEQNALAQICLGKKWGLIDRRGATLLAPVFSSIGDFSEGLASASTGQTDDSNNVGYIDYYGDFVVRPRFAEAHPFREGISIARIWHEDREDYEWGYVDRKTLNYTREDWCEHYEWQRYEDILDLERAAATLEPPSGDPLPHYLGDGFVYRRSNGSWLDGRRFRGVSRFSDGLAVVTQDRLYGVIDREGQFVVEQQYERISDYSDGLAAFQANGKWGFMDKAGQKVIEAAFDDYKWGFQEGVACVGINGLAGMIDRSGTFITGLRYKDIKRISCGLASAQNSREKWGYLNKGGRNVIPFTFDAAEDFFLAT